MPESAFPYSPLDYLPLILAVWRVLSDTRGAVGLTTILLRLPPEMHWLSENLPSRAALARVLEALEDLGLVTCDGSRYARALRADLNLSLNLKEKEKDLNLNLDLNLEEEVLNQESLKPGQAPKEGRLSKSSSSFLRLSESSETRARGEPGEPEAALDYPDPAQEPGLFPEEPEDPPHKQAIPDQAGDAADLPDAADVVQALVKAGVRDYVCAGLLRDFPDLTASQVTELEAYLQTRFSKTYSPGLLVYRIRKQQWAPKSQPDETAAPACAPKSGWLSPASQTMAACPRCGGINCECTLDAEYDNA